MMEHVWDRLSCTHAYMHVHTHACIFTVLTATVLLLLLRELKIDAFCWNWDDEPARFCLEDRTNPILPLSPDFAWPLASGGFLIVPWRQMPCPHSLPSYGPVWCKDAVSAAFSCQRKSLCRAASRLKGKLEVSRTFSADWQVLSV